MRCRPIHLQHPRICQSHALYGSCDKPNCAYSHDYALSQNETDKLRAIVDKVKNKRRNKDKADADPVTPVGTFLVNPQL